MDIWVCEYSVDQDCFHVDTLGSILEKNRRALAECRRSDYIPLNVFLTAEEAHRFAAQWERKHP